MNGQLIAIACAILVVGMGAGVLIGVNISDNESNSGSSSGGNDDSSQTASKELKDYSLQFGTVEDNKTTFYITFDAGKGGILYIYDGKTLMNSYVIDPGSSARKVSVNTALSTLNHLSFEFDPRDIVNEFIYSMTYNTRYGVIMSGDETIYGYSQTPTLTVEKFNLQGFTAKVGYPSKTLDFSETTYILPNQSASNYSDITAESKIAYISYIQIDFVKFYPRSETWNPITY